MPFDIRSGDMVICSQTFVNFLGISLEDFFTKEQMQIFKTSLETSYKEFR